MHEMGIVPNYTTNGVLVRDETVSRTKELGNAAAITFHEHLEVFWRKAIDRFSKAGIRTNAHVIISDKDSIDKFKKRYDEFKDKVEYFVLLPYMNVGHAAQFPRQIDYDAMSQVMDEIYADGKLAIGANFYNWLVKNKNRWKVTTYLPEVFSKYLVLDDAPNKIYNNSFEMKPVPFNHETGCELGHSRTDFDIDKLGQST